MNVRNRIVLMLGILSISWGARAHQPDLSSTLLVEQDDQSWVLHIRASLTAFEYEIDQHFGDSAYATPAEFQALVIHHVQDNVDIKVNHVDNITLSNGIVKLGHETSITFQVAGIPESIELMTVTNSSFSQISRNQTALIILKKGFAKEQFVLNNSNHHTAHVQAEASKFVLVDEANSEAYFTIIFILMGLSLAVLGYLFYKNKSNLLHSSLKHA